MCEIYNKTVTGNRCSHAHSHITDNERLSGSLGWVPCAVQRSNGNKGTEITLIFQMFVFIFVTLIRVCFDYEGILQETATLLLPAVNSTQCNMPTFLTGTECSIFHTQTVPQCG